MKDLSFFLLKNSLAFKVRKGFKNLCTGDASTSTLNQLQPLSGAETTHHPTLEEMIMQLNMEEKIAAGRMSCVNSSDILRSARNALNQYPRFSLDGKDAMYRSSFRNNINLEDHAGRRYLHLPAKVAGERVVWCKPGVVGRLMGLDAMPIPLKLKRSSNNNNSKSKLQQQNLKRQQQIIERRSRNVSSCSRASNPRVALDLIKDEVGWPMGRFI